MARAACLCKPHGQERLRQLIWQKQGWRYSGAIARVHMQKWREQRRHERFRRREFGTGA